MPEASPKGESKSSGEVERAVQSVHGLARTVEDFLEQQSGITLESRSPLLAWLVEDCSNLLLLLHKDGHTAYMRLTGKPWRVELPSFGECVDYRKRTRHKLESRWSRGVFAGVRVKKTERIVMDETGTCVVQSVRRDPDEQRYDHRLLQKVHGTPWEPNPGDVSTYFLEPMLIIPQLPDVDPAPTKTYHCDNKGTRNVYIRKTDLEKFGYTAGCPACEVHRAGLPMSGQGHTSECRKRLEDVMVTDASTATRIKATRVRQTERIIRDSGDSGTMNPNISSRSSQHKRVR